MCVPGSSLLNFMLPLVIEVASKICSTMRVVRGTTCARQNEAVKRCVPREKVGIKTSRYTAQHNNKENDLHLGVIAVPVAVHVNVEFLPRALRDKAVVDELRAERHVR